MDSWTPIKVCSTEINEEKSEFPNKGNSDILSHLKFRCRVLEREGKLSTSDSLCSDLTLFRPIDIRKELCHPNFILTDFGWRLPMLGRRLPWGIGYIVIINDFLHIPQPLHTRRGDYEVKNEHNEHFYIWHRHIEELVSI